jgi:hypothetical protein
VITDPRWKRVLSSPAIRAHLSSLPPISHHGRLGGDSDAQDRGVYFRLRGSQEGRAPAETLGGHGRLHCAVKTLYLLRLSIPVNWCMTSWNNPGGKFVSHKNASSNRIVFYRKTAAQSITIHRKRSYRMIKQVPFPFGIASGRFAPATASTFKPHPRSNRRAAAATWCRSSAA